MSEKLPYVFHSGIFMIGTRLSGAPNLTARLSVLPETEATANNTVTGDGRLTQAINPPLDIQNIFSGKVYALGFGTAHQIFGLRGQPPHPLAGAPTIPELMINLNGIWGNKGVASYTYCIGSQFHEVKDVPVTVEWLAT